MFNQAKMVMKIKKAQKELASEVIEVEAGDGAVIVRISADQNIKEVKIDPERVDLDDIAELERWIKAATKDAISRSQQVAAEKMKPLMGGLGNLGM
jgi:DNA-binding YbaB/EbfC family protein